MFEEAHANIAKSLNRIDHELDLAIGELAQIRVLHSSTNIGPTKEKLERIISSALKSLAYCENTLSRNGPFSQQLEDIESKSQLLIALVGELIGLAPDELMREVKAQQDSFSKADKATRKLLLSQLQKHMKLTRDTSLSKTDVLKPMDKPIGTDYVGATILTLVVAFDVVQTILWNRGRE